MVCKVPPPERQDIASLPPLEAWRHRVASGALAADPAQEAVATHLNRLYEALLPPPRRLFRARRTLPRSLYIWGDVGRGKSMLMDLFFDIVPVKRKRRVHFHAFMQEVHTAIHRIRTRKSGDPVGVLVSELAEKFRLLCFDELQATDVADATLLFRLFEGLFNAGVVIVATGNRPPASIYQGGVQAERFEKFTALIEEKMDILSLMSDTDYRRLQEAASRPRYFHPLGPEADRFVLDTLKQRAPGAKPQRFALEVKGRKVWLTLYGTETVAASFAELCEAPLGPADYLAITREFDTLVLTGVPRLGPEKRNEAKRFVTLIDTLYENRTRLIMTAEAPPDALYPEGDGSFEFQRTASRLVEMQSGNYACRI